MSLGYDGGPQVSEVTRLGGVTRLSMNSNWKFDVSLDGTLLSRTTNLNPAVRICRVESAEREKISTSNCHF